MHDRSLLPNSRLQAISFSIKGKSALLIQRELRLDPHLKKYFANLKILLCTEGKAKGPHLALIINWVCSEVLMHISVEVSKFERFDLWVKAKDFMLQDVEYDTFLLNYFSK